jgi:hypothetical protein
LRALPQEGRRGLLARLLRQAEWAEAFRRRHGRAHPFWGDGSLMASALGEDPPGEPPLADVEYLRCLGLVVEVLCGLE